MLHVAIYVAIVTTATRYPEGHAMFSTWPVWLRAVISLAVVGLYYAPCLLKVSERAGTVPKLEEPAMQWSAADYWDAVAYTPTNSLLGSPQKRQRSR